MSTFIVTLVVTMVINGNDYEQHQRMGSVSECWERAQGMMHVAMEQHDDSIKKIGIGCVIDAGDPA
jgi:hypothetical protein